MFGTTFLRRCIPVFVKGAPAVRKGFSSSIGNTLANNQSRQVISNDSAHIPVDAYYAARGIDITKFTQVFEGKQHFTNKCVTITLNHLENRHISIFKYGSVVLFNVPKEDHVEYMRKIQSVSMSPIAEGLQKTDSYRIKMTPGLDKPSVIKAEHVNIQSLDANNLEIIGTVMAQTVALDYYMLEVESLMDKFMQMNLKIEETGNYKGVSSKVLHRLIASNNTVITNVLSKMGIFEGSDAAWENADYYDTWENLRKDFELDYRYKDLSLKLDIVKEDARFFLEVLHTEKSTKLEWTIIWLIAIEIGIGLAGLTMGGYHPH